MNEHPDTDKQQNSKRPYRADKSIGSLLDKLPPQAIELEEAVLGGMMLDRDAVTEVVDMLKPDSFYLEKHQHIYAAMHDLFLKSQPIDILTVTEQLRKNGKLEEVGGPVYVTMLTHRVGSTANIEHHARIVSERFILRELIKNANEIIKDSYEETSDVFEVLDKAEQGLFQITEKNLRRSYEDMGKLVAQAIKQLETLKGHEDGVVGVPSGLVALDRITSGWQQSDLIIVAARPAMGKTAMTLSIARNAAVEFRKAVAFFSLEMSAVQLVNRLISAETGIPAEKLKRGNLTDYEWIELTTKVERLAEAPIYIDDTPAINIFELRAKCRRLKMQHDIQMVVVDYLQLMSGGGGDRTKMSGNREQEISMISRSLKSIAKELNIPVIALSQLSRAVENRGGDKRPQLSDLRESGSIEQDADMVIFLYRPEYYGFDVDEEGNSSKGVAEIIIAKHRNGPTDTAKVRFISQNAKFTDLDSGGVGDSFGSDLMPIGEIITVRSKINATPNTPPDDDVPF